MIPIPAIDLKNGRCVRLMKGDMRRETVYGQDPVAIARHWEREGARRLHVVDLDGAVSGRPVHAPVIHEIARTVAIPVEVGGGIRTLRDMEGYLRAGVHTVILGTTAFLQEELLTQASERFPGRLAVALDTRNGRIMVKGWLETAEEGIEPWIDRVNRLPVFALIATDVGRDGTQKGPNSRSLETVLRESTHPVIASGGVGTLQDLKTLVQVEKETNKSFFGVIIGRALYEKRFTLSEAIRALESPEC